MGKKRRVYVTGVMCMYLVALVMIVARLILGSREYGGLVDSSCSRFCTVISSHISFRLMPGLLGIPL